MTQPFGDTHALIAALRQGDPEAVAAAYQQVFGGDLGRHVLAHIALEAGVGRRYGPQRDPFDHGYHQGGHDLALEIMDRAGYDQASAVVAAVSGQLEGRTDERSATPEHWGYAEPKPEFSD